MDFFSDLANVGTVGGYGAVTGDTGDFGKLFGADKSSWDPQGYQFQAPQINGDSFAAAQDAQNQTDQNGLDAALKQRAMGTGGPSVAEGQLKQGLAQAQMAGAQTAANVRGGSANQFAAYQSAHNAGQTMAGQANQQAAQLRAGEQIAAQGQYGQQLATQRGENFAINNANLGGQSQGNATNAGIINGTRSANASAYAADQDRNGKVIGGAMSGAGAAAAVSDPALKQNVAPLNPHDVLSRIETMPVPSWEYKPGIIDDQRHIGPMAPDFAARFGGDGHSIDYTTGLGVAFAGEKALAEKHRHLEGKLAQQESLLARLDREFQRKMGSSPAGKLEAADAELSRLDAARPWPKAPSPDSGPVSNERPADGTGWAQSPRDAYWESVDADLDRRGYSGSPNADGSRNPGFAAQGTPALSALAAKYAAATSQARGSGVMSTGETTALSPGEEVAFRSWAQQHRIRDVDHPDSFYDYRGAFKDKLNPSGGHWPDTYKQHGHPTFSVESKYSAGPGDGGSWDGETFHAQGGKVDGGMFDPDPYGLTEDAPAAPIFTPTMRPQLLVREDPYAPPKIMVRDNPYIDADVAALEARMAARHPPARRAASNLPAFTFPNTPEGYAASRRSYDAGGVGQSEQFYTPPPRPLTFPDTPAGYEASRRSYDAGGVGQSEQFYTPPPRG